MSIAKISLKRRRHRVHDDKIKELKDLLNQVCLLEHPHIVKYHEYWIEEDTMCVMTECLSPNNLHNYLRKRRKEDILLDEQEILIYFLQIAEATKYLHNQGLTLKGITMKHFLMYDNNVLKLNMPVISEFEEETRLPTTLMYIHEARYYQHPETVLKPEKHTKETDLWPLGCLLHEMLTLRKTFNVEGCTSSRDKFFQVHNKIRYIQYEQVSYKYSEAIRQLVASMFDRDPTRRPSIDQILGVLNSKKRSNSTDMETDADSVPEKRRKTCEDDI
ncbi:serine/threonine-protein kinase Nek9-like isoform X2 [Hydractinia symbiolongicarpus]|nr:serine/threonine-protein kinase Nek9-like isoform X2 [Hydractinia symbiolongicarpus]